VYFSEIMKTYSYSLFVGKEEIDAEMYRYGTYYLLFKIFKVKKKITRISLDIPRLSTLNSEKNRNI